MPIYSYTALSESGKTVSGASAADTPIDLERELVDRGLLVQSIKPQASGGMHIIPVKRVKLEYLLLFNQELIALLSAGLTVPAALSIVADRPGQPIIEQALKQVLSDVLEGISLSEACSRCPSIFDSLYIAALKTAEKSGDFPSVLRRYQDYLKQKIIFQRKLSQALAYPAFLLITLFVIMGVLFIFVMPRFVRMYANFNAELPEATRILMQIVENIHIYAPFFSLLLLIIWMGYSYWNRTKKGRLSADKIKMRLPILGKLNHLYSLAQMSRTLSTLLSGGMPLISALKTTSEALTNQDYASRLYSAINNISSGQSISSSMDEQKLLTLTATKMLEAGEASGNFDTILSDLASYYEEIIDHRVSRITTLIEPILMLLMGIFVGGIILIMYLPIFSIADVVK